MKMTMKTKLACVLGMTAVVALGAPLAAQAQEPAPAGTWLVTVELADKAGATTAVTLAVSERSCADAESVHESGVVKLEVCHTGAQGAAAFGFRVERTEQKGKTVTRQRTTAQARLAPGKTATISRMVQAGGETRVSATLGGS